MSRTSDMSHLQHRAWATVELADVVIRVMDTLACFSIELDELIEWKLDYNATRPWMHGGKAT